MRPPRSRKSSTSRSMASRRASFEEGSLIIGVHLCCWAPLPTNTLPQEFAKNSHFYPHLSRFFFIPVFFIPILILEDPKKMMKIWKMKKRTMLSRKTSSSSSNRTDPLGHFGSVGQSLSSSSSIWRGTETCPSSGVTSFILENLASQSSIVPISAGAMSTPPECLWLISCFSR